ncbi:MAG: oligogalacturonate lyase family protein [Firmicutes bacterium]|nr:oligogalacturonate lyase family protein [Bacillota bacterium]
MKISDKFPKYTQFNPKIPVYCVTPNEGGLHRFFDTSPFSPSGRYIAVLRFPQEKRQPTWGESAKVVLIDLHSGMEKVVYETMGWEPQLGANINWGISDNELYFNDTDTNTWMPFCVKLNPLTGEKQRLEGTIYHISPDGKHIISSCMRRMRRTQFGYGVMVPDEYVPRNFGFKKDDGLYITDTHTGKCRLMVSIKDVFDKAEPLIDKSKYEDGECYGFHCKYNPQGDKIMFSMRWFKTNDPQPWNMLYQRNVRYWIITMNSDGSNIKVAVGPDEWDKHGHHTNWYPNGKMLSMNLCIDGDGKMYLVKADYDGGNYGKILKTIPGSGHPTIHPNGRNILTDAYRAEPVSFGDGTVPLRFINIQNETEETVVRINVDNDAMEKYPSMRVDPHPAWAKNFRYVAFNGFVDGKRRVYIADFSSLL